MPTNVIMPALGVAQEKGTLIHWRKAEGAAVTKGEPLMEVETDKATVEIDAPASGVLTQVSVEEGEEVPVGQTIALILAPGEQAPEVARAKAVEIPRKATERSPKPEQERPVSLVSIGNRIAASPAARRIAREKNINLASLKGTGPQGSIVAADVLRGAASEKPTVGVGPSIRETLSPSAMRRIVGERMSRSKQTAPHFYLSMDIDMTEVSRQRSEQKEKGEPVASLNDFILHATARALIDFPSLNAAFTDHGIEIYSDINLGTAVALEDGLVVPVLRNADRLSLHELSERSRELTEKAQKKKLMPMDYEGGSFTVSNLGMLGVDSFTAIINPPQCAILAVGQVAPRVVTDGDGMMIRTMMTATLSADHRVIDGAGAARFLKKIKQLLEQLEV